MFLVVVDLDKYFHIIDYSGKLSLTTACGVNFKRNICNLLSVDDFPNNLCGRCAMIHRERFGTYNFRYDRNVNEQNIVMQADRLINAFKLEHKHEITLERKWKMLSKYKNCIEHNKKFKKLSHIRKRKIHD